MPPTVVGYTLKGDLLFTYIGILQGDVCTLPCFLLCQLLSFELSTDLRPPTKRVSQLTPRMLVCEARQQVTSYSTELIRSIYMAVTRCVHVVYMCIVPVLALLPLNPLHTEPQHSSCHMNARWLQYICFGIHHPAFFDSLPPAPVCGQQYLRVLVLAVGPFRCSHPIPSHLIWYNVFSFICSAWSCLWGAWGPRWCPDNLHFDQGDGHHYQHLVAQLLTRDDPETLWRLYLGLSQCVTIISQQ